MWPAPASHGSRPVMLVAVRVTMSRTFAGVRFGLASSISATMPATCGVAIEVPLITV